MWERPRKSTLKQRGQKLTQSHGNNVESSRSNIVHVGIQR